MKKLPPLGKPGMHVFTVENEASRSQILICADVIRLEFREIMFILVVLVFCIEVKVKVLAHLYELVI